MPDTKNPTITRLRVYLYDIETGRQEVLGDIANNLTPTDLVALQKDPSLTVEAGYGMRNLSLVMSVAGPLKSTAARKTAQ